MTSGDARTLDGHERQVWSWVFGLRTAGILVFAVLALVPPWLGGIRIWLAAGVLLGVLPYNLAMHRYVVREYRLPVVMAYVDSLLAAGLAVLIPRIETPALMATVANLGMTSVTFGRRTGVRAMAATVVLFAIGAAVHRSEAMALGLVALVVVVPMLVLVVDLVAGEELAARRRFGDLVEGVDAIVWEFDVAAGHHTFVGSRAEDLLGYSRDDFWNADRAGQDMFHRDDRARFFAAFNEACTKGLDQDLQYRMLAADGREVWLHTRMTVEKDARGRPARVRGVSVDITAERHSAEDLARLTHQYELVLTSAGEAIFGIDPAGRITFLNPAAAQMLGWEVAELIGQDLHEVVHHWRADGTPYPETACPIREALSTGTAFRVEGEVFWRRDGRSIPVEYVCTPILEQGGIQGAVVSATDITERTQGAAALAESEERFRAAFENAPIGMALIAPDGRYLEANPAMCRLVGRSEEELQGLRVHDITHPDDLDGDQMLYRETLRAGSPGRREKRYLHADGHMVWVELIGTAVPGRNGTPEYSISQVLDITERKRVQAALDESEARFRALFERAPIGIVVADAEGRQVESNPAFQRMLGYSGEELRQMPFLHYTHPDDAAESLAGFRDLAEGRRERIELEKRYVRRDGSVFWGRLTAARVSWGDGEPAGPPLLVAMAEDISGRKEMEAEVLSALTDPAG